MSGRGWRSAARWIAEVAALGVLAAAPPGRAAGERPLPVDAARHVARGPRVARGLEGRVALLARALDLDARQRVEIEKLLAHQRERIAAVWSDETVPAAQRVLATRAIEDQTIEQMRALLDDAQRKKLGPPRPREPEVRGGEVEAWLSRGAPR